MRLKTLVMTCALLTAVNAADAQTVAGKWTANFPMRVRMQNGMPSAEQQGVALVTLEQKGDSVFGTWAVQNTPAPVPPRQLKGTLRNGQLSLESSPTEAKINMNGNESTVSMRTYYEGTVSGDAIDGTIHSKSEDGTIESPPMKWTAKRDSP